MFSIASFAEQAGDGFDHLTLVYNQPQNAPADVSFKIQLSNDLGTWVDAVVAAGSGDRQISISQATPVGGLVPTTVQLNDPIGSPSDYAFMRVVTVFGN